MSSNSVGNHTRDQQIERGRPILLITRLITDRIGLHSVLLPIFILSYISELWFSFSSFGANGFYVLTAREKSLRSPKTNFRHFRRAFEQYFVGYDSRFVKDGDVLLFNAVNVKRNSNDI